jgi:hypothetical protein
MNRIKPSCAPKLVATIADQLCQSSHISRVMDHVLRRQLPISLLMARFIRAAE